MEIASRKAEQIISTLYKNYQNGRAKENMQGKSEYEGEWKQVKKGRNV